MNTKLHTFHGKHHVGYPISICLILGGIILLIALLRISALGLETRVQAQPTRAAMLPRPGHIVIVIEENKSYDDIIGSSNAPYLNSLAADPDGVSLTNFYALHHPSQPNYMEFFSGSSQGVFNDTCPKAKFTTPNLGGNLFQKFGNLPQNKLPFVGYAQNLPLNSSTCTKGEFARKHCPWLDFTDVPESATVNFTKFPKTASGFDQLPVVSFVIPDLINDMHSAKTNISNPVPQEISQDDAWLRSNLDAYVQWAKIHNSLLIITWDEDSSTYTYPKKPSQKINTQPPQNHIATILIGAMVKPGATSDQRYTHYDLLRTIEDMYGLPLVGGSQNASDITGIWK